jgi:hypothetical protein
MRGKFTTPIVFDPTAVVKLSNSFVAFISETLFAISQKKNLLLLRFTFLVRLYNASLMLINFLSFYGKTVSGRTLLRHEGEMLERQRSVAISLIKSRKIGYWFDNFCPFIRHSKMINASYDTYSWTSVALIEFSPLTDFSVCPGRNILPTDYNLGIVNDFIDIGFRHAASLDPVSALSLPNTCGSVSFIPLQLLNENVSSTTGLANLLLAFQSYSIRDELETVSEGNFVPFNIDVNIYYRIVKKLKANDAICSEWEKKKLVPLLGYWHSYKVGMEKLFASVLPTIIGMLN